MSKTTKFLSIALNMLEQMQDSQLGNLCVEALKYTDAKKMESALNSIEKYMKTQGISCGESTDTDFANDSQMGSCDLFIIEIKHPSNREKPSIEKHPCCAQIKLFPLQKGETPQEYKLVNGRMDMIREMTNDEGRLTLKLPIGIYALEISKGSEYEVIKDFIFISADRATSRIYQLTHYVDLKEMGWYAGDLHHHSIYSSPVYGGTDDVKETPEEVCQSMRAMGASYGALSDHHNILNHEIWSRQNTNGFVPICSKEISTSNGHVLALGVKHDVIYEIPEEKDRTDSYLRSEFVRITDEIKEAGGLAQLNHPRDESVSISWNPNFNDMLPIFETMEIWNGSHPMCPGTINAKASELWRSLLDQGNFIPATTGSDTHNIKADDYHILTEKLIGLNRDITKYQEEEALKPYCNEIILFSVICNELLPFMEEWAKSNLTSAGVRTYVNIQEHPTPEGIMDALRRGKSFLTNGPIIIPFIQGKSIGDTVQLQENKINIHLKIYSNYKLQNIYIYTKGGREEKYELEEKEDASYYDYSRTLEEVEIDNTDYIFFAVMDTPIHLAITNPIFFTKFI